MLGADCALAISGGSIAPAEGGAIKAERDSRVLPKVVNYDAKPAQDLLAQGKLSQRSFVRQEEVKLADFLGDRFGAVYAPVAPGHCQAAHEDRGR